MVFVEAMKVKKFVALEMTTEASGFSTTAINVSKFDVPAGFRQVESEIGKELRK